MLQGSALQPLKMASRIASEPSKAPHEPPITKVSSVTTINENKGVSITKFHEVPGKSSTDGTTSAAGKSANLSLDALAKAKKALQMQKELSEKLKKIPQVSGLQSLSLSYRFLSLLIMLDLEGFVSRLSAFCLCTILTISA